MAVDVSLSLGQQLAVLTRRGKRLSRVGLAMLAGGGAGLALAALFLGLASFSEPSASLGSVHVPEELLRQFSDATSMVSGHSADLPFESAAARFSGMLHGAVPKAFALMSLMVGVAMAMVRQSFASAIGGIGLALSISFVPTIVETITGQVADQALEISARAQFKSMVEQENWTSAVPEILKLKDHGGSAGQYVLTQIALKQQKKKDAASILISLEANEKNLQAAGAKPSVIYALDVSLNGAARSRPAVVYEEGERKSVQSKYSFASFFGATGLLLSLASLLFGGVGFKIIRRVDRVRSIAHSNNLDLGEDHVLEGNPPNAVAST